MSSSFPSTAADQLAHLLALADDQARLATLQANWPSLQQKAIESLLSECEKRIKQAVTEYNAHPDQTITQVESTHLRSLLGLIGLLARREYAPHADLKKSLPYRYFPQILDSVRKLLLAQERLVESSPQPNFSLRRQALHTINRYLEAYSSLTSEAIGSSLLMYCSATLFSSSSPSSSSSSSSKQQPELPISYKSKLLETFGLLLVVAPKLVAPRSHEILKQAFEMLAKELENAQELFAQNEEAATNGTGAITEAGVTILEFLKLVVAAENVYGVQPANDEKKEESTPHEQLVESAATFLIDRMQELHQPTEATVALPAAAPSVQQQQRQEHIQYYISLLDFISTLFRKLHMRLPVAYPSSVMLYPRAWPFGSEEYGEEMEKDGEEKDREEEEEQEEKNGEIEEEEEEDSGDSSTATHITQYYTDSLVFNPARASSQPLSIEREAASQLFSHIMTGLLQLFTQIGRDGSENTETAEDATVVFTPLLASSSHQYCTALESILKHSRRTSLLSFIGLTYESFINWLAASSEIFPRKNFIKLRRYAVGSVLSILYTIDVEFEEYIGSDKFFSETFKLFANPLLSSHLVWFLRTDTELLIDKVLPKIMRGLLNTKIKNPSVKSVQMIMTSLGNVVCFVRAVKEEEEKEEKKGDGTSIAPSSQPLATLPLISEYLPSIIDTLIHTITQSPSGTGQVGALVLNRILLTTYEMPEVREKFVKILDLYLNLFNESLIAAESESAEDYDMDDQDLVTQLQYCVLDMMHLWFQKQTVEGENATNAAARNERVVRGLLTSEQLQSHPFRQDRFLTSLLHSSDCVSVLQQIFVHLLHNARIVSGFEDDVALRNSEIALVMEILEHPEVVNALFGVAAPSAASSSAMSASSTSSSSSTLTPSSAITSLISALILLADDDSNAAAQLPKDIKTVTWQMLQELAKKGERIDRKANYVDCIHRLIKVLGSSAAIQTILNTIPPLITQVRRSTKEQREHDVALANEHASMVEKEKQKANEEADEDVEKEIEVQGAKAARLALSSSAPPSSSSPGSKNNKKK